jgi:glycerol-3-phosphate cytidylyltransferase
MILLPTPISECYDCFSETIIPIDEVYKIKKFMGDVGVTASCFDLLHAGHSLLLKEMKKECTSTIVFLHSDPSIERPEKNKPIQSLEERFIQLSSNRYVDYIVVYNTEDDLRKLLVDISPDIRFLGDDYVSKKFTGDDITSIVVKFVSRSHGYSSSSLRKRIAQAEK